MNNVYRNLIVGAMPACGLSDEDTAVVHACKHPCHQDAVGYSGSLPKSHPQYLAAETDRDLYLNMVDPDRPLFRFESFEYFFGFAVPHWEEDRKLVIHCNQGHSRSPSLALLFLAGSVGVITDENYASARTEFVGLYPEYAPSKGIAYYLQSNWEDLVRIPE